MKFSSEQLDADNLKITIEVQAIVNVLTARLHNSPVDADDWSVIADQLRQALRRATRHADHLRLNGR